MKLKTMIGYSIFIMLMHGQAQANFNLVEEYKTEEKAMSLGVDTLDIGPFIGARYYLTNSSDGLRYFKQPVVSDQSNTVSYRKVFGYWLMFYSIPLPDSNSKSYNQRHLFTFEENNGIQPRTYFVLNKMRNEVTRQFYWAGKLCVNTTDYRYAPTSPEEAVDQTPLEWAEAFLCRITEGERQSEAKDNKNDIVGDDMRLSVDYIIDGKQMEDMELIALKVQHAQFEPYSTLISIKYVGCLNRCNLNSDSNSYVGRIDKQGIVILYLKYEGERVTGSYVEPPGEKDLMGSEKDMTGEKIGNTMTLSVLDDEGAVSATLTGTLDDGIYSGTWHSTQTDQTLPFTMYMRPY